MRRVVKVGGSLLGRPSLVADLNHWLGSQSAAENVVIVGGGELIDAVRKLDAICPEDPVEVHWRCVSLLDVTFKHFCSRFPDWNREASFGNVRSLKFSLHVPTTLRVAAFYHRRAGASLPLDWRTTTDAIAAHLAVELAAEELVILKSCDINGNQSLEKLEQAGVIDQAMKTAGYGESQTRVETLRMM